MMNAMAIGMQQRVQQQQVNYAYVDPAQQATYQKF
jgi:hypothetical protein